MECHGSNFLMFCSWIAGYVLGVWVEKIYYLFFLFSKDFCVDLE